MDKLVRGCQQLGIDIDCYQQAKLLQHLELLAKWNKRLNLTAINSGERRISHHVLDCLAIQKYVKGRSLLDIGSGGGFPGLPLAIVNPQWAVTLLDSRGKRVEFLRSCIANLALKNVSLVNSRIEDYRPPEKFDTLAARAFSSLADLVRLSQPNLARGTRLLALKGRFPAEEIALLVKQQGDEIKSRTSVEKLQVPCMDAQRHLIIIDF